jgi:hypothetical protein
MICTKCAKVIHKKKGDYCITAKGPHHYECPPETGGAIETQDILRQMSQKPASQVLYEQQQTRISELEELLAKCYAPEHYKSLREHTEFLEFLVKEALELLAIMHRDGGQHTDKHGVVQSVTDAISIHYKLLAERDAMKDALLNICNRPLSDFNAHNHAYEMQKIAKETLEA